MTFAPWLAALSDLVLQSLTYILLTHRKQTFAKLKLDSMKGQWTVQVQYWIDVNVLFEQLENDKTILISCYFEELKYKR